MFSNSELRWIIDFDGTLVNVDLGAEFSNWLDRGRRTSTSSKFLRYMFAPINRVFRILELGQKFRWWSFRQSEETISMWVDDFLDEFDSKIEINMTLILELTQRSKRMNVLLTGCPSELVTRFLIRRNLDVFGEVIGMSMRNSFLIDKHPYGRTKVRLTMGSERYCAIGDSWPDRYLLSQAEEAIVIPRSTRLANLAKQKNWLIVPAI